MTTTNDEEKSPARLATLVRHGVITSEVADEIRTATAGARALIGLHAAGEIANYPELRFVSIERYISTALGHLRTRDERVRAIAVSLDVINNNIDELIDTLDAVMTPDELKMGIDPKIFGEWMEKVGKRELISSVLSLLTTDDTYKLLVNNVSQIGNIDSNEITNAAEGYWWKVLSCYANLRMLKMRGYREHMGEPIKTIIDKAEKILLPQL